MSMRRFRLRRKTPSVNPWRPLFIKLLLFFLLLCLSVYGLDRMMRPTIQTMICYKAKTLATKMINDAVYEQLESLGYTYQDLVAISKDDTGAISAIETDTIKVNKIKSSVIKAVSDVGTKLSEASIQIPIGTLTNIAYFSARGPSVTLKVIPQGVVKAQFVSKFTSAGVNQTHHQLMINVSMEAAAVIPGFTSNVEIPSDFIIAETVIVGDVPEYYTQITGADQELLEKIDAYDRSSAKP